VLLALLAGCVDDRDRQNEIKEKVRGGDYEEAARLAHQYFSLDKRILLVTLEYIADQKSRAAKEAYKNNVVIQDVEWSTNRSGGTVVVGRVLNRATKSSQDLESASSVKGTATRFMRHVRPTPGRFRRVHPEHSGAI